jgi:type II secretory pathway component PulC
MLKDNLSPEEKLLKLIRGDKKVKPSGAAGAPSVGQSKAEPAQAVLKSGKINFFQVFRGTYFTRDLGRKIIFISVLVSLIYLVFVFIYPLVALNKIDLPVVRETEKVEISEAGKKEAKPYEYYLNGMQARPLFGNASGQQGETEALAIATEASSIKDINLVGVIMGDSPQAVIEDKKAQKTYYLIQGQFIGDFQVEEIMSGKVILNYHGQKFELNV